MSLTFFAENNAANETLWVSDGTAAGTHQIASFGNHAIDNLVMIGARVYFTVSDGVHGEELWVSDGTTAGTTMVLDINPGPGDSFPFALSNIDGMLFFAASDGTHGKEPWVSDGTAAGTFLLKDIDPGGLNGFAGGSFTNINGSAFFDAVDPTHGLELWKSDGTAAGTVMVKDINPGSVGSGPSFLTNVNGTLFFEADDGTHGQELWTSDGTDAGTVMVKDINPGPGNSFGGGFSGNVANVNGTFFFEATDGTNGVQLWKSDGTAAGTVMVKAIAPGGNSAPQNMTNVNGTLFFSADDGVHGDELWKSDGTAAGTVLVKDIWPGINGAIPPPAADFTSVGSTLFFLANDGVHGYELWKSDGTDAGTMMVKDINPTGDSIPQRLVDVNGVLEFYATDGTAYGLWQSDGTAAGTVEIATHIDLNSPIGFAPQPLANDLNGDHLSDILWRNPSGGLADWSMVGGAITSGSLLTAGGAVVAPDASWSVAGISDFNGDGSADVLWRSTGGTLATWLMNGNVIASSGVVNLAGVPIMPDASWSIAGTGDFDGDSRSDILWRNTSGALNVWTMNGSSIVSAGNVTSGGVAVTPDATWSVAGVGDFNSDNRKDVLWRSSSGEVSIWFMNGSSIASSGDATFGGAAVRPDASWSVAGVGDFNHDGFSDILWRNSSGSLAVWLMNGSNIVSTGGITSGGLPVTPDASWHIVEVGDFNGDSNADILWRSDSGAMAEWLMNGTTIMQSVTPNSNGAPVSPDASWTPQARPTIG